MCKNTRGRHQTKQIPPGHQTEAEKKNSPLLTVHNKPTVNADFFNSLSYFYP